MDVVIQSAANWRVCKNGNKNNNHERKEEKKREPATGAEMRAGAGRRPDGTSSSQQFDFSRA